MSVKCLRKLRGLSSGRYSEWSMCGLWLYKASISPLHHQDLTPVRWSHTCQMCANLYPWCSIAGEESESQRVGIGDG